MVARANYEHNLSQIRVSRFSAWAKYIAPFQVKIQQGTLPDSASSGSNAVNQPKKFLIPDTFFPPMQVVEGLRQYQVLIFKFENLWRIGVVLEIFRGALAKKKKDGDSNNSTRTLRVTKPISSPLKVQSTSKLKIAVLHPTNASDDGIVPPGDQEFYSSCLCQSISMDPHHVAIGSCVYGQLPVKKVLSQWPSIKIVLGDAHMILERFKVLAEQGSRVHPLSSGG